MNGMAGSTFEAPGTDNGVRKVARYGISPYFDFDAGDIELDGAGRVQMADARESWLMWCVKSVLTERGAYMAYSDNIGTDMRWALEQGEREAQQEAMINAITDALLADPAGRTLAVNGFGFTWSEDSVRVSFALTGADGYQGSVEAGLGADGLRAR